MGAEDHGENGGRDVSEKVEVNIYPLNSYYFGSKLAIPSKHHSLQRFESNYAASGMRICVEAVMMVELFKHPHLLVLQTKNSIYKLPGGRLRPGESDTDGLRRKLTKKLSLDEDEAQWEESTKLFLVKLPETRRFTVPKNMKLLSVPLCQILENHKTFGPVISAVPELLSKFSFNMIGI